MTTAVVVSYPRRNDPLPPQIVNEFDALLARLDLHTMQPHEWRRFKTIMVIATLEAADADSGQRGYRQALAKWRLCRHYDRD